MLVERRLNKTGRLGGLQQELVLQRSANFELILIIQTEYRLAEIGRLPNGRSFFQACIVPWHTTYRSCEWTCERFFSGIFAQTNLR